MPIKKRRTGQERREIIKIKKVGSAKEIWQGSRGRKNYKKKGSERKEKKYKLNYGGGKKTIR